MMNLIALTTYSVRNDVRESPRPEVRDLPAAEVRKENRNRTYK